MASEIYLLYGADGNTCSTRDYEMSVLNVWPNLIQNKRDDVRFYSQKEHITLVDSLFVASCQIHPHFLREKQEIWHLQVQKNGEKKVL